MTAMTVTAHYHTFTRLLYLHPVSPCQLWQVWNKIQTDTLMCATYNSVYTNAQKPSNPLTRKADSEEKGFSLKFRNYPFTMIGVQCQCQCAVVPLCWCAKSLSLCKVSVIVQWWVSASVQSHCHCAKTLSMHIRESLSVYIRESLSVYISESLSVYTMCIVLYCPI